MGLVLDRLTDEKSITFTTMATEHGEDNDALTHTPSLNVRCSEPDGVQVFVNWGGLDIPTDYYYRHEVGMRFDSSDATFERWETTENGKALISPEPSNFISQAIFAIRLYMQFEAEGQEYFAEFPIIYLWDAIASNTEYANLCRQN